jgi:hypothetical protein
MFTITKPSDWFTLPLYKKIQYYKTQLNEHYAPYVDKLRAKKIVKDICGDELKVPSIIRILDSPDDLTLKDLIPGHIIKSAHGSAWNLVILNSTILGNARRLLHMWNRHYIGLSEQHYKYIKPQFFIEEIIDDMYTGKSGNAVVFMFRCIHGKPVTIGIKKGNKQNMYFADFRLIEKQIEIDITFSKDKIIKMLALAEKLSAPFEFVRIDFYLSKLGDIYFSEYTFTPAGGQKLYSDAIEKELGALWT